MSHRRLKLTLLSVKFPENLRSLEKVFNFQYLERL